jgi:hypothetical protein
MTLTRRAPDVDYVTRDYEGFRHLLVSLVDRSASRWTERAAADIGVMVLEILADQLDHLAYAGDRVAEEAFVTSARDRELLRRHAMLGDYRLDRGSATRGHQHFRLKENRALHLPAGTPVAQRLAFEQDPEQGLIAETLEDVDLDARRNELELSRAAGAGSARLHLRDADRKQLDLQAIGLRPGMLLAIVDRDPGEVVTVARVQGSSVALTAPLGRTYLAGTGDGRTRVLGNMVPIRRGKTIDWALCGRGGAALGEIAGSELVKRRVDQLRDLRDEAEAARERWVRDRSLVGWWELANATVTCVVRELREAGGSALRDDRARALDEQLRAAADLFRDLLRASDRGIPDALQPTRRVPVPRQEIPLSSEQPPLWLDGVETLKVRVGVAGHWAPWIEVEDFLRSSRDDRHYIAEIKGDGHVTLRFGDGVNGAMLPADSQVMVQRVTGDVFAGDLGAGALLVIPGGGDDFDLKEPTETPLPTSGARPLEGPRRRGGASDELALRIRRALSIPVVPVTLADYAALLEARPDIAETAVSAARSRVDVVIRPRPGSNPARALAGARDLMSEGMIS